MTRRPLTTISAGRARALALLSPWSWRAAWGATSILIAGLYLLPQAGPPGAYHADTIAHFLAFAALGVPLRSAALRPRMIVALLAVNVALAVGLELAQSFVPGREVALLDVAGNLTGLAAGIAAGFRLDGLLTQSCRMRNAALSGASAPRATRAE